METIEERAKEKVDRSSCKTREKKDYYYAGYILGATEQEAITRKATIDKAKKVFCDTCMGQCKDKSHCDTLQKFTYALEG